jgi:hypothetical protein
MASSQGTSMSSNSFGRWASHDIFLSKYHFLLHILRFLFFFSDNIMADVATKQQMTALFLSTTVTRTRRHTELTKKKTEKPTGKPVLCQRTLSSVFRAVFYILKLHTLTYSVLGPFRRCFTKCVVSWSVIPGGALSVKTFRTNLLPPKSERYLCNVCTYMYVCICMYIYDVTRCHIQNDGYLSGQCRGIDNTHWGCSNIMH